MKRVLYDTNVILDVLLQRRLGARQSSAVLADLLTKMRVAAVTETAIRPALADETFTDFENAVCHTVAQEAGVAVIGTRNTKDFAAGVIPAVLPELSQPD